MRERNQGSLVYVLIFVLSFAATYSVGTALSQAKAQNEYVTVILPKREAAELLRQCDSNSSCSQEVMKALQQALGQPATGISEEDQEQVNRELKGKVESYGDPRRPIQSQPDKP